MASPFAIFRKHERLMMAVLGVMAMIAFVFFDPLFGMRSGGRGGAEDPVVAETKLYGDIHESDLARMRQARELANRFVQQTIALLYGFSPPGYFGSDSEASVVGTMLMARKAEQMGMRMTDDEVTRFLQMLSENRLTGEQFSEILNGIGGGRRAGITRRQLYDALRTELLAQRFAAGFSGSQQTTPAERWEAYQKLNSRASIEAIPVAVADFLDKVAEPDATAIQTLYDNYKQFEPTPGAPIPGFKIPKKVAVQYFVANYEQFEDPSAVTYDEVVNEYEKNKNTRYLYSGDIKADDAATKDDQPGEEKPAAERTDEGAPAGDKPNADQAPSEQAPAEQPPEQKPAAEAPSSEPEPKPADAPPQTSARSGLNGTELALASFADDEKPAEAAPATDQPAAEQPAEGQESPATASAGEPSTDANAEKPAGKVESLSDEYALPTDVAAPKYDPLWKVEPAIRTELARRKAGEKMQQVLNELREQKLVKYGNDRTRWEVKHEKDKTLQPPKPLDFDALAAEYKLTTHTTKLLSGYELSQVEGIGESFVGQRSFVQFAFGPLQLYQPVISSDTAGNQYLVWKIEEQEARVPELSEIRDEVIRAAKMIEARKPAIAQAKALTETAQKDSISLAELATRDVLPVIKPAEFSWLTYGTTPNINNRMPPRLSTVQDVEDVGNEFMQAVFSQPAGGLTAAFNNPQTIVYAIQVKAFEPGLEVLRRSFLADDFRTYAQVTAPHQREQLLSWNRAIEQEAGLKWIRQPDVRREQNANNFAEDEGGDMGD